MDRSEWASRTNDRAAWVRAWLVSFIVLSLPVTVSGQGDTGDKQCLNCHGQPHIAELDPFERWLMMDVNVGRPEADAPEIRPGIYLGPDVLGDGVHSQLSCVDCHADATVLPHALSLETATCANDSCHGPAGANFLRGVHAEAAARGAETAPICTTCHGSHDIRRSSDRDALTHPLNVISTCGGCHGQHFDANEPGAVPGGSSRVESYLESIHGLLVTSSRLAVAATCADCHGFHEILPAADEASTIHRENIPRTCGDCHVGISETYANSIHGQIAASGDERAPVCSDCHTAHSITRATAPGFARDIINECGDCHDRPEISGERRSTFYETYRASYHGQVTELGSTRAARCSDCHGAHDIRPVDDEQCRLHVENRVAVCTTCHEGANARFAQFDPHADYRDRDRYPGLHAVWLYFVIVMSAAFGFFGLHTIMWFLRSVFDWLRSSDRVKVDRSEVTVRRFTRLNRINHALVIITFFGLTLTGLPLLFSDREWASALAGVFGGVHPAGLWHRFFAIMLIMNFILHFIGLAHRWKWRSRRTRLTLLKRLFGPDSMLPRWKDFTDCLGMLRWFVIGGEKPRFDRWTYWEKFDYWAEVGGSMIIGGSGLLLWFPTFFAKVLPGWAFNAAMIVHGYEALLAVGFIFTIHFFNAHLRIEKFPVDDVIFTGRVPESEFRHERPDQYERLHESGELSYMRAPAPPRWMRLMSILIGIVAMVIGTGLVLLIILAGLEAL